MFSRNEKYGQALHLQYGYDQSAPYRKADSKTGLMAKLKSVFIDNEVNAQIQNLNASVEVALDKSSIEQAIQAELRNPESAANENRLELFKGKIA